MAYLGETEPEVKQWPVLLSGYRLPGILGINQTVGAMLKFAGEAVHREDVKRTAVEWTRNCPREDFGCYAAAMLGTVRPRWDFAGHPQDCQELFTPDVHLERIRTTGRTFGDCVNLSVFYASLMASIGARVRFQVVDLGKGNGWDHVRAQVFADGEWISMDFSDYELPDCKCMMFEF